MQDADARYATKQDVADLKVLVDALRTNATRTTAWSGATAVLAPLLTAMFTAALKAYGWWP